MSIVACLHQRKIHRVYCNSHNPVKRVTFIYVSMSCIFPKQSLFSSMHWIYYRRFENKLSPARLWVQVVIFRMNVDPISRQKYFPFIKDNVTSIFWYSAAWKIAKISFFLAGLVWNIGWRGGRPGTHIAEKNPGMFTISIIPYWSDFLRGKNSVLSATAGDEQFFKNRNGTIELKHTSSLTMHCSSVTECQKLQWWSEASSS